MNTEQSDNLTRLRYEESEMISRIRREQDKKIFTNNNPLGAFEKTIVLMCVVVIIMIALSEIL